MEERIFLPEMLFTGTGQLQASKAVRVAEDGTVLEILDAGSVDGEVVSGILCPGFINAHCHLELSYMKGRIKKETGLPGFVKQVVEQKQLSYDNEIAREAEAQMIAEGVVGVGDISNTANTVQLKQNSQIRYHSFVEIYDLNPTRTEKVIEEGNELVKQFDSASLVLHSPYTCTPGLIKHLSAASELLSIHQSEDLAEDELFSKGSGPWTEVIDYAEWLSPSGRTSLDTVVSMMEEGGEVLFVHNTFAREADVASAIKKLKANWCLCPKANLYINGQMPDVEMLRRCGAVLCLGTDSLASNDRLSILDEMLHIQQAYSVPTNELLTWGTSNGATALHFHDLGVIAPNKKPGLVQIEGLSPSYDLTPESRSSRLA
jgi:cytosine/adenosine deaminase-related metal-dependent hydrolase